jgi:hypothetical protein
VVTVCRRFAWSTLGANSRHLAIAATVEDGRFLMKMELVERYRGIEILRTTAGHLVVVDPLGSQSDRIAMVELLAANGVLDALFFPGVEHAREVIDSFIVEKLTRLWG